MPDPVRFNDSMPLSDARATLRTLNKVGAVFYEKGRWSASEWVQPGGEA